ncbi:MAG: hypothetical protein ACKO3I_10215 [Synechococcales cyanobacterium]
MNKIYLIKAVGLVTVHSPLGEEPAGIARNILCRGECGQLCS